MEYQTALNFLLSFLGGGLVAAALNWAREARSERRAMKADRVRMQLQKLYGPLFFVTSQAEKILEVSQKHSEGYKIQYIERKLGTREEATTAIEVNNQYSRKLNELANQAAEIMRGAYAYIEPKDSVAFQNIVVDTVRFSIEQDESGKLRTPFEIYQHVGDMYFFRGDFISLINRRFNEMRSELVELES